MESLGIHHIFVMMASIYGNRFYHYFSLLNSDAGLNAPEHQRVLSELASIPRVHFAASIDHVNAPLLWDLQTKDRFAWVWYHVPTFKPYIKECSSSAMPSLFLGRKYVLLYISIFLA